jgi:hypothetical protein
MSRITRKPLKRNAVAVANYVHTLPGAVFFSAVEHTSVTQVDREALTYAARLQQVRASYERDDCQEMLWHDLSAMGFDSCEIREFVTNPSAITSCGYGHPIPPRAWRRLCAQGADVHHKVG